MASRAHDLDFLVDQSTSVDVDVRQRIEPMPRILHTMMTDQEFEDCGLQVLERRLSKSNWLRPVFDVNDSVPVQWLARGPANDDLSASNDHIWLDAALQRLDALREIAAEEELTFNEESATAAMAFVKRVPNVRLPGIFLTGGNIRLLWDGEGGEQIGLQFQGDNRIQYVIFQRDGSELGSTMGAKSHDAMLRLILGTDVGDIAA